MAMNLGEFVVLLAFLTALLFVPIIIIQFVGQRRPVSIPSLQECPNCGAENYAGQERCYCCGRRPDSPPTAGTNFPVLESVKQADQEKARRESAAKIPEQATEE